MGEDTFDDTVMYYADARFEIRPYPTFRDLKRLVDLATEMGYSMPYSMKQYSLEDVQEKLRSEGPSAFLKIVRLREDISPRSGPQGVEQFLAERLSRLAPADELVVMDPYLFPPSPYPDAAEYARLLARLIAPILTARARVTAIVNDRANSGVQAAVQSELGILRPEATMTVAQSDDFHDRFWIADRSRGVIVGTSLNKLGSKLFFTDQLRDSDVRRIVAEFEALGV